MITSRVDGIDADVPRPQLGGERCCGRIHCSLRGIPHAARELETDIDDAPAGGIEMLRGRLRGQDQAEDMGVQMPPKVLFVEGSQAAETRRLPHCSPGCRPCRTHFPPRQNSCSTSVFWTHSLGSRSPCHHPVCDLGSLTVAILLMGRIVDHHRRPFGCQILGDRVANSLGRARHEWLPCLKASSFVRLFNSVLRQLSMR